MYAFTRLVALLLLSMATCCSAFAAELTKDSLATVKENLASKKAILVDVREDSEWKKGHIEGAVLVPLSDLSDGVDAKKLEKQLAKDKIVYTHCVVGKRSVMAGKILEKMGYQVRPLKAGYSELVEAGLKKAEE